MQSLKKLLLSIRDISLIILLVMMFGTFILSQNGIPSDSMTPTLQIGDRIIVSMLPYYYRQPKKGEIVVFNGPDGQKWIKRVVGMPGEVIDIREGDIYIDDRLLDESSYLQMPGISALNPLWSSVQFPYTVPKDSYFLMGDNRLASNDCRYIGAISEDEIIGKAILRVYPFNQMEWFHP